MIFSNMNFNCSNLLDMINLQEQVKKHSVTKYCSDLSLFEYIILVISKKFQILGLQYRTSKVLLNHQNNFFSQWNNFGNKIPVPTFFLILPRFFSNSSLSKFYLAFIWMKCEHTWTDLQDFETGYKTCCKQKITHQLPFCISLTV